jgi:hypothetical protein
MYSRIETEDWNWYPERYVIFPAALFSAQRFAEIADPAAPADALSSDPEPHPATPSTNTAVTRDDLVR